MPIQFQIGQMLEITLEERDVLSRLADEMHLQAKHGDVGWLKAYLEGHRHAHQIISNIFKRSHASS